MTESASPPHFMQSASRMKLKHVSLGESSDDEFKANEHLASADGYRIIGMESLAGAVSIMRSACHNVNLYLGQAKEQQYGMTTVLYFGCSVCHDKTFFPTNNVDQCRLNRIIESGRIRAQDGVDLNRRLILAGLETGIGRSGITKLLDIMQLHFTGHSNMWTKHTKNMLLVAKCYIRPILDAARERLRQMVLDENDIEYCRETSVEVGVRYDGTWSKRGFTANYGLGFIISVDSGQVLDFEFLSKVCPECDKNRDAGDEWMAEHKADCQRNHQGPSKSMEVVAAQNIWRRSSAYNMKYKWMICDGDSASYNCIWDIYGACENCHHSLSQRKQSANGKADRDSTESGMHDDRCCNRVIKLDCIGHIQKRMGRSLPKWKQQNGVAPWKKGNNNKSIIIKKHASNKQKYHEYSCEECKRSHTLTGDVIKSYKNNMERP